MSRLAPKMTLEDFKQLMEPYIEKEDFPVFVSKKVETDLSKVHFDFENYEFEDFGFMKYPIGFRMLSNGVPVLFVNAGGDWEVPICYCLYWDGKEIRGYIPDKGNVYNREYMTAYGSEDNSPKFPENAENTSSDDIEDDGDEELILADVANRIQSK